MRTALREAFRAEMRTAIARYHEGDLDDAFRHLERAHILGQRYVLPHTASHAWMLRIGLRRRDVREIVGQLQRIAASLVFSRIWVPIGNTGGADVRALQPMPVPDDLRVLLAEP